MLFNLREKIKLKKVKKGSFFSDLHSFQKFTLCVYVRTIFLLFCYLTLEI